MQLPCFGTGFRPTVQQHRAQECFMAELENMQHPLKYTACWSKTSAFRQQGQKGLGYDGHWKQNLWSVVYTTAIVYDMAVNLFWGSCASVTRSACQNLILYGNIRRAALQVLHLRARNLERDNSMTLEPSRCAPHLPSLGKPGVVV